MITMHALMASVATSPAHVQKELVYGEAIT